MKKFPIILGLIVLVLSAKCQKDVFYFKFFEPNKSAVNGLITRIISIDKVSHDTVYAYANSQELAQFKKLGYSYTIIPSQSANTKTITMATAVAQMANWDRYPTYSVYRDMMKKFERDYPTLCKLDSIGSTDNGHKIICGKIVEKCFC